MIIYFVSKCFLEVQIVFVFFSFISCVFQDFCSSISFLFIADCRPIWHSAISRDLYCPFWHNLVVLFLFHVKRRGGGMQNMSTDRQKNMNFIKPSYERIHQICQMVSRKNSEVYKLVTGKYLEINQFVIEK